MSVNVCLTCSTPLIMTFERPGAEFHCLDCGDYYGIFSCRSAEATPELTRRLDQLTELFREGLRGPLDLLTIALPEVVPSSDDNVKCHGCGIDSGRTREQGKPHAWYSRKDEGGEQIACSRSCIDVIAERTGKTRVVLPW